MSPDTAKGPLWGRGHLLVDNLWSKTLKINTEMYPMEMQQQIYSEETIKDVPEEEATRM